MSIRAAVLTRETGLEQAALRAALQEVSAKIEIRALDRCATNKRDAVAPVGRGFLGTWLGYLSRLGAHLPFSTIVQLASWHPNLVVSEAFGSRALQAALYRILSPRSRLLLCALEPPRRYSVFERMVLSRADGFLADGEDVADAVELLRFPVSQIYAMATPSDLDLFLACPRHRSAPEAHRLVYAGELSPQSGAADFLICLAAWAEQNPHRSVELWWAGEGDLSGVLEAQPLPDNLSQRFLGQLDRRGTAAIFAQCGVLVMPSLAEDSLPLVPEALAAGLVILASRRTGKVRQVVRDGVLGWTFDPLRPDDMLEALGKAMESSVIELDQMRDRGLAVVRSSASESFTERVRDAITAVLAKGVVDAGAAKSS